MITGRGRVLDGHRVPPLWCIAVLALALRVLPWFRANTLLGVQEVDDGVYYGAAKLLLHGLLPYSDYTIVHPPGVSVLLLPFAAIGSLLGDPVGMAGARFAIAGVAVANTVLVYRLALRLPASPGRARLAALSAAAVYAVMPNAVIAEHTVLLEPLINLFCLLAVGSLLKRQATAGALAAGVLCAAAISVKLFACVYVVAFCAWLLLGREPKLLRSYLAGLLAGTAVLILPFALSAPTAFWHDVVVTQLSRPSDATSGGADRVVDMVGLGAAPLALGLALVTLLVAIGLAEARRDPISPYRLWLLAGLLTGAAFSVSASYFPHYGAFLAPPLAMIASRCVATKDPRRRWDRGRILVLVAVLTVFVVGAGQGSLRSKGQSDLRLAGRLVPAGSCVFYEGASLAIAADLFADPTASCPSWIDARGIAYTRNTDWPHSANFYPAGFLADTGWQSSIRTQLEHADFLLLGKAPGGIPEWDATTRAYALGNFQRVLLLPAQAWGRAELWQRTTLRP